MIKNSSEWTPVATSSMQQKKMTRFYSPSSKEMKRDALHTQGIIHKEYVLEGQTVHGEFYCDVMKRLLTRIRCVRHHLAAFLKRFLLHDDARPRTAMCVTSFLTQQHILVPLILSQQTFSSFPD
ncbi:hypothetical protein TNCV_1977551 [Trichonephila clavipes]|nr:hypothetical protein TNCV_1977551 [Trichonephila clavipes]